MPRIRPEAPPPNETATASDQGEWPVQLEPFGHLVRRHRRQRGMNQRQLGNAIGHDYTYVSKLETGAHLPSEPDEILQLARALHLTLTEGDELLRAVPRFRNVCFRSTATPFKPADEQLEAGWLNMLTWLMQVYVLVREESADKIADHLAVFAGVPVLMAFALDPAHKDRERRLRHLLVDLAARDVRTAALMTLRDAVNSPANLDQEQRRKQRLRLSFMVALAKLDGPKVDLAFRDVYSASLTQAQRQALRQLREAIEKKAPGLLRIELPAL